MRPRAFPIRPVPSPPTPAPRPRTRSRRTRTWVHDEAASFQVFEAVLTAILVFSAILVIAFARGPTRDVEQAGVDLGALAQDTLNDLRRQNFTVDGEDQPFAVWVGAVMNGTQDTTTDADRYLDRILPVGARHALRFDTGTVNGTALHLVPYADPQTPLNARAGMTYFTPNWTAYAAQSLDTTLVHNGTAAPGDNLNGTAMQPGWSTWTSLRAPTGNGTGPGGVKWLDHWNATMPSQDRVPYGIPFGVWQYAVAGSPDCPPASPCQFRIALPGTPTDRPLYGLQLVVWRGA